MTSNVIPFGANTTVPSFFTGIEDDNDLTAHASLSFPVISIKGKVFTVVRDGDRHPMMNPKDPESPANYLDIVLVKSNPNKSKAYYDQAFKEGEDIKPRCFSNDGKHPDASVAQPCSQSCATCPYNAFGSRRNPDGTMGKGKACSDSVRIAVAAVNALDDPYLIRVPATSMKALGELGRVLAQHKVPYQGVVVRISFDPSVATPRLLFKPIGYVDEPTYRKAVEVSKSELVRAIIGEAPSITDADREAEDSAVFISDSVTTVREAPVAAPAPFISEKPAEPVKASKAKPAAAPAPAAEPAETTTASADSLIDSFANVFDD